MTVMPCLSCQSSIPRCDDPVGAMRRDCWLDWRSALLLFQGFCVKMLGHILLFRVRRVYIVLTKARVLCLAPLLSPKAQPLFPWQNSLMSIPSGSDSDRLGSPSTCFYSCGGVIGAGRRRVPFDRERLGGLLNSLAAVLTISAVSLPLNSCGGKSVSVEALKQPSSVRAIKSGPDSALPEPISSLTANLTQQEVVGSIPSGRPDPFKVPPVLTLPPPKVMAGRRVAQLTPEDVRRETKTLELEGIMSVRGVSRAFITYNGMAGDVSVGMVGRSSGTQSTRLLPAGWRVVSIDPVAGMLVIRKGLGTAKFFVGGSSAQDAINPAQGDPKGLQG